MCEDKVKIPFLKQEFLIKETIPAPNNIKIPYKDETLLEDIVLSNLPSMGIQYQGKIILDMSGDICDYKNYLEANGILKFESILSGPYETQGGVIQFRRLYFHFRNLEIPVKIIYQYNPDLICSNQNKEDLSENQTLNILFGPDENFIPSFSPPPSPSPSPVPLPSDGSGNKDNSGNLVDGSENIFPKKQLEFKLNANNDNTYRFEKYFVTNGLNETNQNVIFNNLENKFKTPNNIYEPIYQLFVDSIENLQLADFIVQELNRILCLKYGIEDKSNDKIVNVYSNYKEKIQRLKINDNYSAIFK
jgi:hypothetical protein